MLDQWAKPEGRTNTTRERPKVMYEAEAGPDGRTN